MGTDGARQEGYGEGSERPLPREFGNSTHQERITESPKFGRENGRNPNKWVKN